MPELVLYWIRLPAKQFLGTFLDIEVDQSGLHSEAPSSPDLGRGAGLQPSVRVEEATVLPGPNTSENTEQSSDLPVFPRASPGRPRLSH